MLAINRRERVAEAGMEQVGRAAAALGLEGVFRVPVRGIVEPIAEHSDHRAHA